MAEASIPAGWPLVSAVCDDGSSPAAVGLSAGETVTCTLTDSLERVEGPGGFLTIVKVAAPEDDTLCRFTGSYGPSTLCDPSAAVRTSSGLDAGACTVAELALPAAGSSTPSSALPRTGRQRAGR